MAGLLNQFEHIPAANISNLIYNHSSSSFFSSSSSIYQSLFVVIITITPIWLSLSLIFGSIFTNKNNKSLINTWSQIAYKALINHFETVNSKHFLLVTGSEIKKRISLNPKTIFYKTYFNKTATINPPFLKLTFEFVPIVTRFNTSILFTWLFLTLLLINYLGMVPGTFCWTTSVGWVIGLNISLIMGPILLISIYNIWGYNWHYFHSSNISPWSFNWKTCVAVISNPSYFLVNFLPANTPYYLVWLIIPIEIISYLIRPLSMGLRISGNLIAGHAILHLIHMGISSCIKGSFFIFISSPVSVMCYMGFLMFEFGVCIIQAYVFTLLAVTFTEQSQEVH